MAVCVEDRNLGLSLFDTLCRLVEELRVQMTEEAPTIRPPSMTTYVQVGEPEPEEPDTRPRDKLSKGG